MFTSHVPWSWKITVSIDVNEWYFRLFFLLISSGLKHMYEISVVTLNYLSLETLRLKKKQWQCCPVRIMGTHISNSTVCSFNCSLATKDTLLLRIIVPLGGDSCQDYPGYSREPNWKSIGLREISWVTWQLWNPLLTTLTSGFSLWRATLIARNMGPIWGRQDPGGPHAGSMNFAIWAVMM